MKFCLTEYCVNKGNKQENIMDVFTISYIISADNVHVKNI